MSRRLRWATVIGISGVLGFAWLVWAATNLGTTGDPKIRGRLLSSWFGDLVQRRGWYGDPSTPSNDPTIEAALAAFREAGDRAVPFLIRQAIPESADPLFLRLRRVLLRLAPGRLGFRWVPPASRADTARRVVAHVRIPESVLVQAVDHDLESEDLGRRIMAIALLACGSEELEIAVNRLRPFLSDTNPPVVNATLQVLVELGRAATNALDELMPLLAQPTWQPQLPLALGNCGPLARPSIPILEDRLASARRPHDQFAIAVALLQIDPKNQPARRLLSAAADSRSEGTIDTTRLGKVGLAWILRRVRANGEVFKPWILDMLNGTTNLTSGVSVAALQSLSRIDPGAAEMFLRERIDAATDPLAAVSEAHQLLVLQPTNAFAIAFLTQAACGDGMTALSAAGSLGLAESVSTEDWDALQAAAARSDLGGDHTHALRRSLEALALRGSPRSASRDQERGR